MGKVKRELFEPQEDVFEAIDTTKTWDLYDQLELAEFELQSAFTHWQNIKDRINK